MNTSVIVVPIQYLKIADFAEAFPSDDLRGNGCVPSTPSVDNGTSQCGDGFYTTITLP
jgi:hypothetical protein